ncbi:MAG: TIGR02677 family protein [Firmicutes bacterium]|nr:TIGR02677 family protein [Bacillota bacterium]
MDINTLKPITEVNYLSAINVARYRFIIRTFFEEYEKINYWLYREDIYKKMVDSGLFENYTIEMCQQDLQSLTEWKNLLAVQDAQKVRTIEDFKNRRFRYQLSKYTVEIERMTMRLENLDIEGSSLEPTLIMKFLEKLQEYENMMQSSEESVHFWMDDFMSDFVRLNQKYQDYIKTLNSAKAEELMKTTEFLLFKDNLISYLRIFVKNMQEKGSLIQILLRNLPRETIMFLVDKATQYECSIPRIEVTLKYEDVFDKYMGKWESIYRWFLGENGINELDRLNDISQEIIRKITKYAQQIVEMNNRGSNRKEQYYHMASIFERCEDIYQAHELSARVFGVKTCLNARLIGSRNTENIHSGVYDEKPSNLHFEPRSRIATKKSVRQSMENHDFERRLQKMELEEKIEKRRKIVRELIHNQILDFRNLPVIDAFTRKTLLTWVSKAIRSGGKAKKDEDDTFILERRFENAECEVRCEDGNFYMPAFQLIFEEKENESNRSTIDQ